MRLRASLYALAATASLALSGCSGIDLGDNPLPEVAKQTGPLTALPPHLKDGSRE